VFAAAELVFCTWLKGASLQVNRFSKVEDRAIFITDRHLYKMDPMKQYKVMKTIPLYNVSYRQSHSHGQSTYCSSTFLSIEWKRTLEEDTFSLPPAIVLFICAAGVWPHQGLAFHSSLRHDFSVSGGSFDPKRCLN